ncbi:PTS glucose transporter subunit IIA, partial [Clostridioides difficile]
SGALGKGVGVIPSESKSTVISPVDGTITIVFPTKHAYGIVTDGTEEMLEVLSGKDYDIACHLHELGKSLDCKIEPKTGARSYKIV